MSKRKPKVMPVLNPNAAGIDIGANEHYVSVPVDRDECPVRSFRCFTPDLHKIANWLKECNVDTVAMESTSVYWIPLYQILESYGFEVLLVNARHVKNVPGRKTDVQDCQWLQQLHSYGLLRSSFRPENDICVLRSFVRQRDNIIKGASTHILRMQKCLTEMNIQLHRVISNITGVTGMRVVKAIIDGEYDPNKLLELKHYQIRCSDEDFVAALTGDYRQEHIFVLKQELEFYEMHQSMLKECDDAIESYYVTLAEKYGTVDLQPKKKPSSKRRKKNAPDYDLSAALQRITGVDFTTIPGLEALSIQTIIAEVGLDPNKWPSEKHFASWLGLSPENKISGNKVLSSRTRRVINRAAIAFRIAANSVSRSQTGLGAYNRRMKARIGAPMAITATARKIACIFYRMLKYGEEYIEYGVEHYEKQYEQKVLANLQKRAANMGFELIKKEAS